MRSLLTRVFLWLSKVLARASRLFASVALGVVDEKSLNALINTYWDRQRQFQDRGHVFSGLMPAEREAYLRHLPKEGSVGLVGCGAGRDLIGLAREGLRVDGFDTSPEMISKAKEYLREAKLPNASACLVASESWDDRSPYDAFVISWLTYSLIRTREKRVELLRKLGSYTRDGGKIILSLPLRSESWQSGSARIAMETARLVGNCSVLEPGDVYVQQPGGAVYFEHRFDKEEVIDEVRAADLVVEHSESYSSENAKVLILRHNS